MALRPHLVHGHWFRTAGRWRAGALYKSADLRNWEYLHPLVSGKGNGKETSDFVDSGEMWECPDFFRLGKKHVFLYSTERKVYWQTGELDPKELIFHPEKTGFQDFGAFYAPKSQQDANGNRILWGWITETRPEAEFSAAGWAGCMSLPRVLSLNRENVLEMRFLPELSKLRESEASFWPVHCSLGSWSGDREIFKVSSRRRVRGMRNQYSQEEIGILVRFGRSSVA